MGNVPRSHDLPPWALKAVERAGQSKLLTAIGAPLVRANSPAYLQLGWTAAHLPSRREREVLERAQTGDGDTSVRGWRQWAAGFWPNAHVLTGRWNAIDTALDDDGWHRPVAGYVTDDQTIHVGVLPEGKMFGTLPGDERAATLAFRQGRHPSHMIMGVLRDDGELVIPDGLQILTAGELAGSQLLVPVADLAARYPGTPLV